MFLGNLIFFGFTFLSVAGTFAVCRYLNKSNLFATIASILVFIAFVLMYVIATSLALSGAM
ncbi:MAG TPA: hypothetical protein VKA53_09220 [Thermoanaerobaculia bacterium]|nr:hypothetical protein [Thermoanaerobaculia bacterium]